MGRFERLLSWFSGPSGRIFAHRTAVTFACGAFSWNLALNTVFLDKVRDVVHMYRQGYPVPLSDEIESRAQEVLSQCSSIVSREKKLVKFFVPVGMEMFNIGNTSTRWGAYIGIPYNFNYKTKSDVDTSALQLPKEDFSFSSRSGLEIVDSLILSDRAKNFAIAREIYMAATNFIYFKCIISGTCLYAGYKVGSHINSRYRIHAAPIYLRALLYSFIGALAFGCYITLKDGICNYYEVNADLKAVETGKDYLSGGIEVYEKMIQRNKALYHALGDEGPKMYTAHGNVHTWIRTKHVPLTVRLDILKTFQKKEEDAKMNITN